ncbi:secretin N-terminal domain-containing protein [Brevundimonas sp.]|uniref:secretin N-terminal domain-containing protein n=1 Tax=Brevundimonas sp. TaxID=1871086 RepID=UPI00286BB0F1|nr:secretin N-terminal domain-containing protein [Brevundimonas sp.]
MSTTVQQPDPAQRRTGDDLEVVVETGGGAPSGRRDTLRIPGEQSATPPRPPITDAQIDALIPDGLVDAALAPQPVPQFVATVFGALLEVPYTMSPGVASRQEIISGGTGGTINKRDLFRLTQRALQQYGIQVYSDGTFITVGESGGSSGAEIVRGREANPNASRVVQFFTVQSIEVGALQALLTDLYPELSGVRVTPDLNTNSLILSGSGRDVAALVRALREIDQPRFAGSEVIRVEPVFWSAEALAGSLEQVLTTEGYIVSRQAGIVRAITILPFPSANQILVFSADPELLSRARYWIDTLDQPTALGDKTSTFVFQVRNTDARSIAELAMGQAPTVQTPRTPVGVPGTVAASGQQSQQGSTNPATGQSTPGSTAGAAGNSSGQFLDGRVISDPTGNRILFTGTASDFAQLRALLATLDVPAPQVVIEVMIAEVTLTDGTDIGVQLFGSESRGDGLLSGGTEGLGLSGEALVATFIGPDYRARLAASASNTKINILQRPQLVTRSGGTARFQVGTDVPIITSQRATDFQSGNGNTDILQSVQYRQTGVILELTPVVYGDRVDITISQEISSAGAAPTGISSPTILNRSLTTQISIGDGWTGVLGGLISNAYTKSNTGIPFLKDIPLVGSVFQTNSVEGDRTELLILITPRILRGDEDMSDLAGTYARDMNAAFRTGRGWSYTLTPFSVSPTIRGIGFDLPSPERASERPALRPRRDPAADDATAPADMPDPVADEGPATR